MNKQLKIAFTVVLAAAGFAAVVPAQAFPTSAREFSQIDQPVKAQAATPQVAVATATQTSIFPSAGMEH